MKLETFFEKFEQFSDAPDAVEKMRELVLGLAIKGKLVEHHSSEGLAAELVFQATSVRSKLIAEKRLRKPRAVQAVAEFETSELPSSWAWTTLNEITEIGPRNDVDDSTQVTFLPMPVIPQRYGGALNGEIRLWSEVKEGFTHLADGDIALAKITPCFQNGKSAVIRGLKNGIGAGTTELHVARPFAPIIDPKYVWIYLSSPQFLLEGIPHMTGSAGQKRVPTGYFACKPFPLPPLAEQQRIVAKVDELMALCDRLEAQQQERDTQQAALSRASLARFADAPTQTNLNFLFHPSYQIPPADLRNSILTLAVQGKLVPQDPKEEPAEVLLERLNDYRRQLLAGGYPNDSEAKVQAKKQAEQCLPSDLATLPSGWAWSTMMQSSILVVDCHNKTAPYASEGIPLIRTTNVRDGKLNFRDPKFITEETYKRWAARVYPESGDILITREAPMGEACIIPNGVRLCMGQRIMLIRTNPDFVSREFLLLTIQAPCMMKRVQDKPVGATVQHLRVGGVETMLLPLPPLPEQRRIVAKVDQLMALVDELETQLAESSATAKHLLEALVAELTSTCTSSAAVPV